MNVNTEAGQLETELVISFEIEGRHYWPNAPEEYAEFGHPHSHIFKVVCFFRTQKSDAPARREQELFDLRRRCLQMVVGHFGRFNQPPCSFSDRSCEGIADAIKQLVGASRVFVGEDWFFGAVVY